MKHLIQFSKLTCLFILVSCLLSFISASAAANQPIGWRVAVLDNFSSASVGPAPADTYKHNLIQGLKLAKLSAAKLGINIKYRYFFYQSSPFAIAKEIPAVKAWEPNIVIGPRFSDQFLVLPNYLTHTLVLSSMASSSEVASMPNNFHSLELPSEYAGLALYHVFNQLYKNRKVLMIVQSGCKDCSDIAQQFRKQYLKNHQPGTIAEKFILKSNIIYLNLRKLLSGYNPNNSIILMPDHAAFSFILIVRILGYLNHNTVFFGDSSWGKLVPNEVAGIKRLEPFFIGIHVSPWHPNPINSEPYKHFLNLYQEHYGTKPFFQVSYATYREMMSTVNAYTKFRIPAKTLNDRLVSSYEAALKHNPFWYKSTDYAAYETKSGKKKVVSRFSILKQL